MLDRMTRLFPVLTTVLALGFLPSQAFSQTAGGRTALAAKQHLKTEVQNALADGKISNLERSEILAEAKEILTVKEYEGLKATMDRLSPPEKAAPIARRSASERAIVASMQEHPDSPQFLSRMLSHVPYMDDVSIGPHPQVSKIASNIPYAKPRDVDLSGAKEALAKVPRLKDTYVEQPTADRPLSKITHVDRSSAPSRTSVRPSLSRKNQVPEKQQFSKYADESISPLPAETTYVEPNVVQQPSKVMEEMGPLAGAPSIEHNPTALATPAGALLPDRSVPPTSADYLAPMQPKGVEAEFIR